MKHKKPFVTPTTRWQRRIEIDHEQGPKYDKRLIIDQMLRDRALAKQLREEWE